MTDIGQAVKEIRTGALIVRPDDRGGWTVDGRRAEWVMLDGSTVDAANPADDRDRATRYRRRRVEPDYLEAPMTLRGGPSWVQ